MSKKIKSSSVVGGITATATVGTAATTASAVVGGSAATIMSATAGTVGASTAFYLTISSMGCNVSGLTFVVSI